MTRVIITGSKGRMGRALIACAPNFRELEVIGQVDKGDDLGAVIDGGDVVVDFSAHTVTPEVAALCASHGKALVIGTTGHSDTDKFDISKAVAKIPVVWASNFSTRRPYRQNWKNKKSAKPKCKRFPRFTMRLDLPLLSNLFPR
jgi:4-hydroxy-tetrahydrodipicolinate reductase